MTILMKRSTRKTQWVGVALAAGFLAVTMWPHHGPAPAHGVAASSTAVPNPTDRSFDDLASEHAVEGAPNVASHADGATEPASPAR